MKPLLRLVSPSAAALYYTFYPAVVVAQVEPPPGLSILAPAPALPPLPQEVPVVGPTVVDQSVDLLGRVGSKLDTQHRTLSQVSSELLALGSEVDREEEQLLGRVLTPEDAQDLVRKHTQLDVTNEISKDSLRRLNDKIENLTSEIAQAHQAQLVAMDKHRAEEQQLEEQIAMQQARIDSLRRESNIVSNLELNHTALLHVKKKLEEEGLRTWKREDDIKLELKKILNAIAAESAQEVRLRGVLEQTHSYGVMCHSKAKDLQATLAAAAKKVVTRSAADIATEGHNNALAKANTQRLMAEGALLRAQVRKVDDSSEAGLKSLTERRQELAELERGIIAEVKNLTERMAEAKNRSASMKAEAEAAQGSEDEHLAETSALQERVRGLSNRVSPIVYSAIEAENAALGDELHQATSLLMMSKASEASAYAAFQQASAQVDGEREVAKAAAESVEEAREEGRRQLEEALKEAKANREKAEELLAKAMAALEATCKPKWDERKQEKDAELAACKQVDEEYAVVAAQMETLKQTLQAQETVEAAVE